jgi:hypothetical protein
LASLGSFVEEGGKGFSWTLGALLAAGIVATAALWIGGNKDTAVGVAASLAVLILGGVGISRIGKQPLGGKLQAKSSANAAGYILDETLRARCIQAAKGVALLPGNALGGVMYVRRWQAEVMDLMVIAKRNGIQVPSSLSVYAAARWDGYLAIERRKVIAGLNELAANFNHGPEKAKAASTAVSRS